MKLFQLGPDHKEYGDRAEWWMVVSDDLEDELAGPFATKELAEDWIKASSVPRPQSGGEA